MAGSEFSPEQRKIIEAYPLIKAVVNPGMDTSPSRPDILQWGASIVNELRPLRQRLVGKMGYAPYGVFVGGFIMNEVYHDNLFSDLATEDAKSRGDLIAHTLLVETTLLIGYEVNDVEKLATVAMPILTSFSRMGFARIWGKNEDPLRNATTRAFIGLLLAGRSLAFLDHFKQANSEGAEPGAELEVFKRFINEEMRWGPDDS